jgi:hypothetical protein
MGGATALAALPIVAAANLATFAYWPGAADWAEIVLRVLGVSLTVSALFHLLDRPTPLPVPDAPAILRRLPRPERGRLLALSAQDHYTQVATDRGRALVLIRLSDAIAEASPAPGLRVHRSHWVALDAVAGARRTGDRAMLLLTDGAEIPVSRANMPAAKAAGLVR